MPLPEGVYTLRFAFTDKYGASTVAGYVITVLPEDADVSFDGDNPVVVEVTEPDGDSKPFKVVALVEEHEPDEPAELGGLVAAGWVPVLP